MERNSKIKCDGCLRNPTFWEWARGELMFQGYGEWRHPGVVFKDAGVPLNYENMKKGARLFERLYSRPMPDEMSYLCPECQSIAALHLPDYDAEDPGDPATEAPSHPGEAPPVFLGVDPNA